MKELDKITPVEAAVKSVVGRSYLTRDEIQRRLAGRFSENEIDEAIDSNLLRLRIRIVPA